MGNIQKVREIASKKGMTYTFICRSIGKSHGYLSEIQNRNGDIPRKMLEPIAKVLEVPVSEITGETPATDKIENIPDVAAFDGFAGESSDEIKNQVEALYVYRTLTPEEIELIRNYRKASQKNKNIVLTLLEEEDDKK